MILDSKGGFSIKKLQDYRWTYLQKLNQLLSDDNIISSPIRAIQTMKIIELTHICEIVSYLRNDDDFITLKEELKKVLHDNIKLILKSPIICPGVNTTILNSMTTELLNNELTEKEKIQLFSYKKHDIGSQRVLKKTQK